MAPCQKDIWEKNIVTWSTNIFDVVQRDFGKKVWQKAQLKAREAHGFQASVRRKNNMLIVATLEQLAAEGHTSTILDQLVEKILAHASETTAE